MRFILCWDVSDYDNYAENRVPVISESKESLRSFIFKKAKEAIENENSSFSFYGWNLIAEEFIDDGEFEILTVDEWFEKEGHQYK